MASRLTPEALWSYTSTRGTWISSSLSRIWSAYGRGSKGAAGWQVSRLAGLQVRGAYQAGGGWHGAARGLACMQARLVRKQSQRVLSLSAEESHLVHDLLQLDVLGAALDGGAGHHLQGGRGRGRELAVQSGGCVGQAERHRAGRISSTPALASGLAQAHTHSMSAPSWGRSQRCGPPATLPRSRQTRPRTRRRCARTPA